MSDSRERYLNDPEFSTLVDYMYELLHSSSYCVTDLRDAAIFAATKYSMENVRAIQVGKFISPDALLITRKELEAMRPLK